MNNCTLKFGIWVIYRGFDIQTVYNKSWLINLCYKTKKNNLDYNLEDKEMKIYFLNKDKSDSKHNPKTIKKMKSRNFIMNYQQIIKLMNKD